MRETGHGVYCGVDLHCPAGKGKYCIMFAFNNPQSGSLQYLSKELFPIAKTRAHIPNLLKPTIQ